MFMPLNSIVVELKRTTELIIVEDVLFLASNIWHRLNRGGLVQADEISFSFGDIGEVSKTSMTSSKILLK